MAGDDFLFFGDGYDVEEFCFVAVFSHRTRY